MAIKRKVNIFAAAMKKGLLIFITILMATLGFEVPGKAGNDVGKAGNDEVTAEAETKIIKGFSGGMMAHTGYLWGGDNPFGYSPSGTTFGIGGVARMHLTEHFRTGFEGYFSSMGLRKDIAKGSYNKVFWAGILADHFWKVGKLYPYFGTSIGGGMETAFYMFEGDKHDWMPEANVVLHKQPFFAIDPFIGCDFAVAEGLRLTVKADWLLAINNEGLNKPLGPRI